MEERPWWPKMETYPTLKELPHERRFRDLFALRERAQERLVAARQ